MEFLLVFILSIIAATTNQLHVILQWIHNPPDRYFTGIAHSFTDYFLYISQMQQGAAGSWVFARHAFTNEPMDATWIYWFNVTLGHIGSWVGLSPFATYNVSLYILSALLVFLWWRACYLLYPEKQFARWVCFLLILTASNIPGIGMFWFSPTPAFNRLGGVPHQILQTILFVLLSMSMQKRFPIPAALAFLASITNPVIFMLFFIASALTRQRTLLTLALFGGFGAWLTYQEFSRQSTLIAAKNWELAQYVPHSFTTLAPAFGPVLWMAPFGWNALRSKPVGPAKLLLAMSLLSFGVFLTPFPAMLGVSPVRMLSPIGFAGLAILATEGFRAIQGRKRIVLIAIYGMLTMPALYQQIIDRITPARNPQLLMDTIYNHVPLPIVEALTWLKS